MKDYQVNCVGYAYHELGLTSQENILNLLTLQKLLKRFVKVDSIEDADVVAVIAPWSCGPVVSHIAVINSDKRTVRHRKGIDQPVSQGEIDSEIKSYVAHDEVEVVFLKLKPRTKWLGK
jgi:hypothetical protein